MTPALNQYYGNPGLGIILSGAKLNNQLLLAKKVADGIYTSGTGHITYLQQYLGNQLAGLIDSQWDSQAIGAGG